MILKNIFGLFIFLLVASVFYADAQTSILFCGGVENDKPVGVSDRYYPDSAGTYLYAFYAQQEPLAMKQVSMEVMKQNGNAFEPVGEKQSYTVKPKWKYTYVKCSFNAPGLYKVRLFDASGNQLAEGMVTIM